MRPPFHLTCEPRGFHPLTVVVLLILSNGVSLLVGNAAKRDRQQYARDVAREIKHAMIDAQLTLPARADDGSVAVEDVR